MARQSWLDAMNESPLIDEQVQRLEHFTKSLADGVIDSAELQTQEDNLVAAMKAVEGELSDPLHDKVSRLLAELSAYNVMRTLHEMAGTRAKKAFGS